MKIIKPVLRKGCWYVYLVKMEVTGNLYCGISLNPYERIIQHYMGNGSRYLRNKGELYLVFISQGYMSRSEALKRENKIKRTPRKNKLLLIQSEENKLEKEINFFF